MPCGCKKKHKQGSGILRGMTWKGPYKRASGLRRRKKKQAGGVSFHGSGVVITGNGVSTKGGKHKVRGRKVVL